MKYWMMALVLVPGLALAQSGVEIEGVYAFQPNPAAKNGAVFMRINNRGDEDVRLVDAQSGAAKKVEIHTHEMDGDVMKMIHLEEGIEIPAGGCALLERGGFHVMLMGLNEDLAEGDDVELVLEFEGSEAVTLEAPVDLDHEAGEADEACVRAKALEMGGEHSH